MSRVALVAVIITVSACHLLISPAIASSYDPGYPLGYKAEAADNQASLLVDGEIFAACENTTELQLILVTHLNAGMNREYIHADRRSGGTLQEYHLILDSHLGNKKPRPAINSSNAGERLLLAIGEDPENGHSWCYVVLAISAEDEITELSRMQTGFHVLCSVVITDLNGDGQLDVAIPVRYNTACGVKLMSIDAAGQISPMSVTGQQYEVGEVSSAYGTGWLADINGDGIWEVLVWDCFMSMPPQARRVFHYVRVWSFDDTTDSWVDAITLIPRCYDIQLPFFSQLYDAIVKIIDTPDYFAANTIDGGIAYPVRIDDIWYELHDLQGTDSEKLKTKVLPEIRQLLDSWVPASNHKNHDS